jgi:hypothetical protein
MFRFFKLHRSSPSRYIRPAILGLPLQLESRRQHRVLLSPSIVLLCAVSRVVEDLPQPASWWESFLIRIPRFALPSRGCFASPIPIPIMFSHQTSRSSRSSMPSSPSRACRTKRIRCRSIPLITGKNALRIRTARPAPTRLRFERSEMVRPVVRLEVRVGTVIVGGRNESRGDSCETTGLAQLLANIALEDRRHVPGLGTRNADRRITKGLRSGLWRPEHTR